MQLNKECEFIPVSFIHALNANSHLSSEDEHPLEVDRTLVDGCDVKSAYEDVVGISHRIGPEKASLNSNTKQQTVKKHRKRQLKDCAGASLGDELCDERTKETNVDPGERSGHSARTVNSFLKSAQEGNIKALRRRLIEGMCIDVQDSYGWTALMCAIHEKKTETVAFLLEQGASVHIHDNQGVSAKEKALSMDCSEIHQALANHFQGPSTVTLQPTQDQQSSYCKDCKVTYTCRKKHITSTIHLLSTKRPQKKTIYGIPENNRGFQMLLRSGWDEEQGLGPEGKGQKFPVKSRLKRDRLGLGSANAKSKMRVTHFEAGDEGAVKLPVNDTTRKLRHSTMSKRDREKQLTKRQCKERDFRLQFTME